MITLGITFCILVNGREEVRGASLIYMRAIKFNFFKLFSPCILLHCAGQESWKVDREILNSMHKLFCWNYNAVLLEL